MKQYLTVLLCVLYAFGIISCKTADDQEKRAAAYQILAGEWQSIKITYPDDPIFKEASKKQTDVIKLHFSPENNFTFKWDENVFSGKYEIKGNELIFIGEDENDTTISDFSIKQNTLILEMNDGFIFELQKE